MDQSPQDPTLTTQPTPQPPGASGQAAISAPRGPVTGLSQLAGIIILLPGLALIVWGGSTVLGFLVSPPRSVPELFGVIAGGIVFLVIGIAEVLAGIGILRGADRGRAIGIFSSVIFGTGLLLYGASLRSKWYFEIVAPILGLVCVLYAYSAIVLWARWRRSGPA